MNKNFLKLNSNYSPSVRKLRSRRILPTKTNQVTTECHVNDECQVASDNCHVDIQVPVDNDVNEITAFLSSNTVEDSESEYSETVTSDDEFSEDDDAYFYRVVD